MSDHDQNVGSGLKVVTAIGQQFERVIRERDNVSKSVRTPVRRGSRVLLLALAGGMLTVGAAGAATGLLPVGSVIPGGSDPEAQHEHGSADQTVVARGVSPVAGPWRLTALRNEGSAEEAQGDCLQLHLSQPPEGSPIQATMLCTPIGDADLKAGSLPVSNSSSGEAELLLFGRAPDDSPSIELTTDTGRTFRAQANEAPAGFAGRTWLMAVPRGPKSGALEAEDRNGKPAGARLNVSDQLERLGYLH